MLANRSFHRSNFILTFVFIFIVSPVSGQDFSEICSTATGDCCSANDTEGCESKSCCLIVCECDSFCCDTEWDEFCSTTGFRGTCGAELLCNICNDSDDDGVPDAQDVCCNTPLNVDVDEHGRPVGDLDRDCDVDLNDFALLQKNLSGFFDAVGSCCSMTPEICDDHDLCTTDTCDSINGACTFTPMTCPAGETCSNGECGPPCNVDSDGDGVSDCDDRCPDTPMGQTVDSFGCPVPVCGNGIVEEGEDCDDGGTSADCDFDCTAVVCSDSVLNTQAGEECDPPDGDTCGTSCQLVSTNNFTADSCGDALNLIGQGAFSMNNSSATQDGPAHTDCVQFFEDQIDHDVWGCWVSPCTAKVFVQTCNLTEVDTKIAVYEGCDCPVTDARLLSCNDDRNEDGCGLQSLVSFDATAGQSYLIRVGTFPLEDGGVGSVSVTCGIESCPGTGDCFTDNGSPGCEDKACCETTCTSDPYCCNTEWDEVCSQRAAGLCGGGFSACRVGAGDCTVEKFSICRGGSNDRFNCSDDIDCPDGGCMGNPGCGDVDCCNTVCELDPYCCTNTWDDFCVNEEAEFCFGTCGSGSGDCFTARAVNSEDRGCDDVDCCAEVCPRDPFCCQVEWDQNCVDSAIQHCLPTP